MLLRVSYSGYYSSFPNWRHGFDSRYPLYYSGRSLVGLKRWLWEPEIAGSNPVAPTMRFLLISIIIIALFLPFSVSAGFLSGPIVPCGRQGQDPCTLCHIFELAKNVIQFLFEFILIIAPVFVLIGGVVILSSAGKPEQAGLGRKIITSAIVGVIIALLAWTILGMVFNALVGGPGFPWPWNEFRCTL